MTQPEALRLADELEETILAVANGILKPANLLIEPICRSFAELRRLHEVNQELIEALEYHQEQTRPIQKTIDVLAKARRTE